MKCLNINFINKIIYEDAERLVRESVINYQNQILNLCCNVTKKKDTHPVLLISGPSGSGKTSTANEISNLLFREFNCESSVISLDNYFRSNNSPDMPKDKYGNVDLESPYCTDLDLLKEHLNALKNGREFMMPVFDFKSQERSGYIPYKRNKGSIAILEGIHALNPLVTGDCGDFAVCAYISVRTRLKSDNNRTLHPRMIRLMRRLCRDCLFRGRDIESVFSYFESVSEGENKYILPFKSRADFQIDTFMPYEVPVYKNCLENKLTQVRDRLINNDYYKNIVEFFRFILPMSEKNVPETSLIREFIG